MRRIYALLVPLEHVLTLLSVVANVLLANMETRPPKLLQVNANRVRVASTALGVLREPAVVRVNMATRLPKPLKSNVNRVRVGTTAPGSSTTSIFRRFFENFVIHVLILRRVFETRGPQTLAFPKFFEGFVYLEPVILNNIHFLNAGVLLGII